MKLLKGLGLLTVLNLWSQDPLNPLFIPPQNTQGYTLPNGVFVHPPVPKEIPLLPIPQKIPTECSFQNISELSSNQSVIAYDDRHYLTAKVCLDAEFDRIGLIQLFAPQKEWPENTRDQQFYTSFSNGKFLLTVFCREDLENPFCELQMKELEFDALQHHPRTQAATLNFELATSNNFMDLSVDQDIEFTGDALLIKTVKNPDAASSSVRIYIQE